MEHVIASRRRTTTGRPLGMPTFGTDAGVGATLCMLVVAQLGRGLLPSHCAAQRSQR